MDVSECLRLPFAVVLLTYSRHPLHRAWLSSSLSGGLMPFLAQPDRLAGSQPVRLDQHGRSLKRLQLGAVVAHEETKRLSLSPVPAVSILHG